MTLSTRYRLLLLLVFTVPIIANAQKLSDGNAINRWMQFYESVESRKGTLARQEIFDAGRFAGYVDGFFDGGLGNELYCPPPSVQAGQIRMVAANYLKSHPESWHKPAGVLVLEALKSAFPCEKN